MYSIQKKGLKQLKVGDPMPSVGHKLLASFPAKDTLYAEGGFSWRGIVLAVPQGKVCIEADFEGLGQVNRIRIESPVYTFKKTISTGMSVSNLKSFAGNKSVFYLSDYDLWDVSLDAFPSIHFLVENKLGDNAVVTEGTSIDNIPETSRIVSIVIM